MTSTISITRDDLARMYPRATSGAKARVWDGYADAITSAEGVALLAKYKITTPLRWVHFAAQMAPETGGLTVLWESGAFSQQGILNTYGIGKHSAGVTPAEAKRLAKNGPALFERVYGLGNPRKAHELGNTKPGDGWRFRGVGPLQITGRWAHETYAAKIGCALDDLAKPINGLHAALIEWDEKDCNAWADKDDAISIRKLINGGNLNVPVKRLNGVPQVRTALAEAKRVWRDDAPADPVDPLVARLGDRGPRVTDLQTRLAASGYPAGPIDGHFGSLTERAVAAFQVAHGQTGTGVANASLWATLEAQKPVVVARADVTAADLKNAGSETITITQHAKRAIGWLFGGTSAVAADDSLGLGVVDGALAHGERVRGLVTRSQDLIGGVPLPSARLVIAVLFGAGLIVVLRWFSKIETRRVEDARSGAHLGR